MTIEKIFHNLNYDNDIHMSKENMHTKGRGKSKRQKGFGKKRARPKSRISHKPCCHI
jgi:hypothetical protein